MANLIKRLYDLDMVDWKGDDRAAGHWSVGAFLATLVPLALAIWVPLGSEVTVDSSGVTSETQRTLLASEGPSILAVLAVPALVAAAPLMAGRHRRIRDIRIAVAIGLLVCAALGALSVGPAYLPAVGLSVAAAALSRQEPMVPRPSA